MMFLLFALLLTAANPSEVADARGAEPNRQAPPPSGQADQTMPLPGAGKLPTAAGLEPERAAAAMTVPEGFRVQLAAGEPMVHQPVAFTFDDRGRVWLAEAFTYPQRAPEGQGKDKIIILEDTDRDGTFDRRTVFAEGLNLVSGLEVGFGGVWVGAAPYLLFIPDANRDDKPDGEPQVLLDGWGYQDTHETLNAFIWGPDGWLYGCQGVFTHSRVGKPGTPTEQRVPLNACVWRYHPLRHEFEVFAWGSSNPWGVDFNDHGQAFISACVIPHLYHVVQGARYQRQAGQHFENWVYDDIKTIADHSHYVGKIGDHAWWGRNDPAGHNATLEAGGGHAHCGLLCYLGDQFPPAYRNSLLMFNIHGNRLNNDVPVRKGSGYIGTHAPDFLLANDQWFRGINLKTAPDGSVYLIDWYDKNACHRHQPEIWDRTNGRVYRVSFGPSRPPAVDLGQESDEALAALQTHPNDWYVRMARRLLQERAATRALAPAALSQLHTLARNLQAPVPHRLRAAWTLHAVAADPEEWLPALFEATGPDSEYLRAWAVQLLAEQPSGMGWGYFWLLQLAESDPSPVVRLYLASVLQRLEHAGRLPLAKLLATRGDDAADHNLPLLIWYGLAPAVTETPRDALEIARTSKIPLLSRFIYRRLAGDPATVGTLLTELGGVPDASQRVILSELSQAVRTQSGLKMPAAWPAIYAHLSKSEQAEVRQQARFITVKFGDASIFPILRELLLDAKTPLAEREEALQALVAGRDPELPSVLQRLLAEPPLRRAAIRALARYDHPATPPALLAGYRTWDEEARGDAILTLASRPAYALVLLDAIAEQKVPRADLSAFVVRQLQQMNDVRLTQRLNEVWGVIRPPAEEKVKLLAELKAALTPAAMAKADKGAGRLLYDKTCGKCHRLFGEGDTIGPDITGANRASLDYLLENMLDPSAVVGKDYQMTSLLLDDGQLLSGLIKSENESTLVLRTVNEEVVVDKGTIEQRTLSTLSLMPEGQLTTLEPAQVRDLIAYLQASTQVPRPGEGPSWDEKSQTVPGALEGEAIRVVKATGGSASLQGMGGFRADRWSGKNQLWWTGGKVGDELLLELPVADAGRYELFAVMTKAHDYGKVQWSLDGKPLGPEWDLYDPAQVVTTGVVSLGTVDLVPGKALLRVKITGANPAATPSYMFGLDYLYLARKP